MSCPSARSTVLDLIQSRRQQLCAASRGEEKKKNKEEGEGEEETHRSVAHIENALLTVREHSSKQGILPVCAYVIESACCQFLLSLDSYPFLLGSTSLSAVICLPLHSQSTENEKIMGVRKVKRTYLFS
jgi:hypothetical protein